MTLLGMVTAHARHHFWRDALPYDAVRWHGVMGHLQVADAYLAALARLHAGRLPFSTKGWSPCTRTSASRWSRRAAGEIRVVCVARSVEAS
jgi:hypothetical protein